MIQLVGAIFCYILALICGACATVAAAVAENALITILMPRSRSLEFSMRETALAFVVAIIAIVLFAMFMVRAVRAGRAGRQQRHDVGHGFPVKLRR